MSSPASEPLQKVQLTPREIQLQQELTAIQMELEVRGKSLESSMQSIDSIPLVGGRDFTEYQQDPIGFVEKELHGFLWSKQKEIITAIRDHKRTSVRSCHGVGKTRVAACAAVWFLLSHPDSLVITTAPTGRQVKDLLWREMRSMHALNQLPGKCLTTLWNLGEKWYAYGFSTDEANKFTGFHAPHILMICDEAAGVSQEIYDASNGILTSPGAKQLLIGNPTETSGKFYDTHHSLSHLWSTHAMSVFDSPNFTGEPVPREVSLALPDREWQEERLIEWGEDSPMYHVRVLGRFPEQGEDSLIALGWVESAKFRFSDIDPRSDKILQGDLLDGLWQVVRLADEPIVLAADIARGSRAENVVYVRKGPIILHMDAWRESDSMRTVGRIKLIGEKWGADIYRVDTTGLGGVVLDRLREVINRGRLEEILFGDRANDPEHFKLFRDEMWWNFRLRLQEGNVGPLADEKTCSQLTSIKYAVDSRGRISIEGKKDMVKRGQPSPDRADALVMAFISTDLVRTGNFYAGGQRFLVQQYQVR